MGLPRVPIFPDDIQYPILEVTSPLTFYSTLETIINRENNERDEYEIIPLEELEVGMVTEVSTTDETEDGSSPLGNSTPTIVVVCDTTTPETETCDEDDQIYSEAESSYVASILDELFHSSNSYLTADCTDDVFEEVSESLDQNLDSTDGERKEAVDSDNNNELVISWLSSLNGVTIPSNDDFELLDLPAERKSSSDLTIAKEELRSFLLTRKMKTDDLVLDQESSKHQHNLRPRPDNETYSHVKRVKRDDLNGEESSKHHRKQERNRIAARKCRQKRMKLAEELTEESDRLRKQNEELTSEVKDLTKELRMLQNMLLDHDIHMIKSQCNERLSTLLFTHELADVF